MTQLELPVVPSVVMKVTRAAADPDSSVKDLARLIEQDAALSAQMLCAVNSSYYSPRTRVATAQRAVSFMGIHTVRNLVLCLAARRLFVLEAEFPLNEFWECSTRRAAAAQCVAAAVGLPSPDELFTVGLCQELGVLVALKNRPELAPLLGEALSRPADERVSIEEQAGVPHGPIGAGLLEQWQLPAEITAPIRFHHEPHRAPADHALRTRLSHAAEAIADLLHVADKRAAITHAEALLTELGVDPGRLGPLVDETSALVASAAEMLEVNVTQQPSFDDIVAKANEGLLSLTLSYQEMTEELRKSLQRQQELAAKLREVNAELERRATHDELTGLPNRRLFKQVLGRELAQARRQGHPLSLLMVDIDHFKRVNDTHGHQAGDHALQQVAQVLASSVRHSDFAARHGGEEFVMVLPFTPEAGAAVAAERLRHTVEQLAIRWEDRPVPLTISVGCATCTDPDDPRAEVKLLRRADDALYEAKESGRNRVRGAA